MASSSRQMGWICSGLLGTGLLVAGRESCAQVPTTPEDFAQGGSQPLTLTIKLQSASQVCIACHSNYGQEQWEPFGLWSSSMHAQAARDPIFQATRAIAEQDAVNVGELCNRCHSPQAWMGGRSLPTNGSAFIPTDYEGVSCSTCHRMVDPHYVEGQSPAVDADILAGLTDPPVNAGNGSYVLDPLDRRRGPFALTTQPHDWLESAFHSDSAVCATCHEVSNPAFNRQPDGTYVLNALSQRHPTGNKYDMMPEQRTYSEWLMSEFPTNPQPLGARFGSNEPDVSACQDCHMPTTTGYGAVTTQGAIEHDDFPRHWFAGGNTWTIKAVRALHPDDETGLTEARAQGGVDRTRTLLAAASDLEIALVDSRLRVRIVNQTGHKLPTGYPEGRRMWVNVRYFGVGGNLVAERGAYDATTATLTTADTKVYEMRLAISPATAAVFGKPAGPYHGIVPVDTVIKDNRIPPRGFTNANFGSIQIPPVGYSYADGQYWDDTLFDIPQDAARVEVRIYYQTTSREYVEFLRDANTGGPGNPGQVAFDQWVTQGKSEPALMGRGDLRLTCPADMDDGTGAGLPDGAVEINDLLFFLAEYEAGGIAADLDNGSGTGVPDGGVEINDLLYFLAHYEVGC